MFKYYEVVILFTQGISTMQLNHKMEILNQYFRSRQVTICYKEHWGLNQLSYKINKNNMAYYELIQFKLNKTIIHKKLIYDLETKLRIDNSIIRYLIIKINKYGLKYAEMRKDKMLNK